LLRFNAPGSSRGSVNSDRGGLSHLRCGSKFSSGLATGSDIERTRGGLDGRIDVSRRVRQRDEAGLKLRRSNVDTTVEQGVEEARVHLRVRFLGRGIVGDWTAAEKAGEH